MTFVYENALAMLKQRDANDRNEEDVKAEIVEPVLRHALGYSSQSIRREHQVRSQRIDFLCRRPDGELDLIVEAKALDVNLDLRPSHADPATRIPKIQLEEYLRKRPDAKHGVFGLLTNGEEWRVCRRIENDVVWLSSAIASTSEQLTDALNALIIRSKLADESNKHSTERGQELLYRIQSANDHRMFLDELAGTDRQVEHQTDLVSSMRLSELPRRSGHLVDENHFVTIGSRAGDGILSIADIFDALRESYLLHSSVEACGVGIACEGHRTVATACRIFAWDGSSLHTSNSFDPELPGTRVLRQLESLARWKDGESNELIEHLNATTVQTEFYDEIALWFSRTGTGLNELRHLIRVLFSWFLKEHGVIPTELFEKHPDIDIHEQLEHLFTQTLSMEPNQRKVPKQLERLHIAYQDAPFLNGSLFNDDPALLRTKVSDSDYISAGGNHHGLFTILKRYEWTLTEHDQMRSDTALDPSMIGSVFERFVALAENIKPGPLARQPDGTYYTPQDLTDEMVCDALAHDLADNIEGVAFLDALNILRPVQVDSKVDSPLLDSPIKYKVIERLRDVTVLDPCTGSGEFIVSVLNTLRRSERRLRIEEYDDFERIRHAIANQLYAVDVNPIAIQVTRFRFYLAMVGTQLALKPHLPLSPFPNLETRITAANSLATRLVAEERAFLGSQLHGADMLDWRAVRDKYTYAHSLTKKKELRDQEEKTRQKLINAIPFAMPHVMKWLENESLGNESIVAQCGLSLLFGREHWDVVIGNPPYQNPSKEEKSIANEYGYRTTPCNDLYCLFVELGLNLIGENGVLTMVVPHSICFSGQKQALRDMCNRRSFSIHLRTYNNRPSAVFPPHPFIKGGNQGAENAQRVTVTSLRIGRRDAEHLPTIHASCIMGLQDDLRQEILRRRPTAVQPKSDKWTMAGTEILSRLLAAMQGNDETTKDSRKRKRTVTFPNTARYFLTCLPQNILDSKTRKKIDLIEDDYFYPKICLYNSTLFLAYWLMVGDAFNVTKGLFTSIRIPFIWSTNPYIRNEADAIGRRFCSEEVLADSKSEYIRNKVAYPNYDFQRYQPDLVRQADKVCIEGYGLKEHESVILEQIQRVRNFRTWDI